MKGERVERFFDALSPEEREDVGFGIYPLWLMGEASAEERQELERICHEEWQDKDLMDELQYDHFLDMKEGRGNE